MRESARVGKNGEDFACGYLVEKGFRILERNVSAPWGELDIVAISPDKTLVFVEVKTVTRGNSLGIAPEDEMSGSKVRRFRNAAYLYANSHSYLIHEERGWRLDVVALVRDGERFTAMHYENV